MKFWHVFSAFVIVFLLGISITYHSLSEVEEDESERMYNEAVERSRRAADKPMGVLLFRGASFIGYHVAKELILNGHHVTIIDSFHGNQESDSAINHMKNIRISKLQKLDSGNLRIVKGDPCNILPLRQLMRKNIFTHFVYVSQEFMLSSSPVNDTLLCVSRILEQMKLHNYIHFTLLSSLSVHSIRNSNPTHYDYIKELTSHNFHTAMQSSMENVLEIYHYLYNIPVTCMRLGKIYGSWLDLHDPIFQMLEKVLHGEIIDMKRTGFNGLFDSRNSLDFANQSILHVNDVVFSVMRVLSKRPYCEYFDVSAKRPTSLYLVKQLISQEALNLDNPKHHRHRNTSALTFYNIAKPVQSMFPFHHCVQDDHIRAMLPEWSLSIQEGVRQMVRWYEQNQALIQPSTQEDVIFTSYFTTNPDPQREIRMQSNNFEYMKLWYFSLKKNNLNSVIFHDGLHEAFMAKFPPNQIRFHFATLNQRSTNDARFYMYKKYLLENPSIQRVVLSDISDVKFQRNPFELMDVLGNHLYIGTDIDMFPNMDSMGWMKKRLPQCFGQTSVDHGEVASVKYLRTVYNAGVIGGSRGIMLEFLDHVTDVLDTTPPELNCNMPAVNFVVHKYFDSRVFTGFPWTSKFYQRQEAPTGVYVIHK